MEYSDRLHKSLIIASSTHRKVSRSEFQKMNLTEGQPKVLEALMEHEGYLQKELAEKCHVEPATMTIILSNMEKTGLIRRETAHVSGGKRAFAVYLTDSGRELASEVNKVVDDLEERSLIGFTEEEKKQFIDYLHRMSKNLIQ